MTRETDMHYSAWPFLLTMGVLFVASASASEIDWQGGITSVYQDPDNNQVDAELTASADLFARFTQPAGEWLIYIEASSTPARNGVSANYPTVNGDARSVLSQDDGGGVQVSELNYTFLGENQRTLMLGLIDPSAWLDRGRIANDENKHFLNGSFIHNATIAFPDYTLGGVLRWLATAARPEVTLVVTGSDGIADTPERSYQDLLNVASQGRGVFVGAGASWLKEKMSWRFGVWLRSDDTEDSTGNISEQDNYGAYGVAGWRSGENALNFRFGVANENIAIASRFTAVAYERETAFGLLGVGVAQTYISKDFRQAGRGDAFDSELFLRIPILDSTGHITPSIQYVRNPGFDSSGTTVSSSTLVYGARFHWAF